MKRINLSISTEDDKRTPIVKRLEQENPPIHYVWVGDLLHSRKEVFQVMT